VSANLPCPRTYRVRAQAGVVSGTAGSPCPYLGKAATGPWTGHRRGRVFAVESPHIRSVHDQAVATDRPCPRTRAVREQPAARPVQSESNPASVLV
jgi:hypothetical protein